MADFDSSKYRSLVQEALDAFRIDSSYAEDMARQAGVLKLRQDARRDKDSVDTEVASR